METEFLPNNAHLEAPQDFARLDTHLRRMSQQTYIFESPIIDQLPLNIPGIYNLGGGRQVGKTTLLKQWMLSLLKRGVTPTAICFLSCELIVDEQSLYRIVTNQLADMPPGMKYLILDEITYVRNWDKSIKYLADTGAFDRVAVVISGSDLTMMTEARMRFPGRRGKASKVDFHYYPLSFHDFVKLKGEINYDSGNEPDQNLITKLYEEFDQYLIHGGFLSAINEYAENKSISERTLSTYSDWIRGDVIKRGKSEHYLREILGAIIKHYTSLVSWRDLVKALSIDHTHTAIDYVSLLESMDAVYVQAALIEDKLVGAPKKQRKFMFNDPFIYHAIKSWLNSSKDPYAEQILPSIQDSMLSGALVESCVVTHFRRHYEKTFYIKAEGEVDVAYVDAETYWPIEVKWTNQLRSKDLKQVLKYKNAQIWAHVDYCRTLDNIPVLPLPWALLRLK